VIKTFYKGKNMSKAELYREFMNPESQLELRKQLFTIWKNNPCSLMAFARIVDINYPTLRRFMVEERPMRTTSLHTILKFITKEAKK
jgi:hypothetical protein